MRTPWPRPKSEPTADRPASRHAENPTQLPRCSLGALRERQNVGLLTSFPELSIPDADREARAIEALTTALRLLDKLTVSRGGAPDFNFALVLGKLIALTRRRDPLLALCSRVDSYAWALSPRRRGRKKGVKQDPVSLVLSKLPVGLQGLSGLPDDLPKIARRRS